MATATTKCCNVFTVRRGQTKALNAYLQRLEEAAKRDHRKIGKQLDLYHMQEEAPGMVFWHNDGWTIFRELEVFVRSKLKEYQYQEVKGPFMMDRVLWEKPVTGTTTKMQCSPRLLRTVNTALSR